MNSPQIVVDEHIAHSKVTDPLKNWITAEQIGFELRQAKGLSDEQIIPLLHRLKRRTFVTIDSDFYNPKLCNDAYCLIYFHVSSTQQAQIPDLLRRLFRIEGFRSIRERMGKVVWVSPEGIRYYQRHFQDEQHLGWPAIK